MGKTVLGLHDLTVTYGSLKALDTVDLVVPDNSVVGIIGPNGAGKSTLIDAVCGFLDHYEGSVSLDGAIIDNRSATHRARAGVRRTFQQGRAIAELTTGDYIRLFSPNPIDDETLDETLGFFDLPPADEPIEFVDVGTRRVLEVAACVAARPLVAFLDEPAAGLGMHVRLGRGRLATGPDPPDQDHQLRQITQEARRQQRSAAHHQQDPKNDRYDFPAQRNGKNANDGHARGRPGRARGPPRRDCGVLR